jgi:multidrug efflux pump subunit AcrB
MRRGGVAVWCIHHPVSTVMLTLTAIVLGLFALGRLSIDLLPQLIYPEIGVRILEPAVPTNIMEDQVTRQLEEQLAITEDAVGVESTSCTSTTARISTSRCATRARASTARSASCRRRSTRRSSSSATRRRFR